MFQVDQMIHFRIRISSESVEEPPRQAWVQIEPFKTRTIGDVAKLIGHKFNIAQEIAMYCSEDYSLDKSIDSRILDQIKGTGPVLVRRAPPNPVESSVTSSPGALRRVSPCSDLQADVDHQKNLNGSSAQSRGSNSMNLNGEDDSGMSESEDEIDISAEVEKVNNATTAVCATVEASGTGTRKTEIPAYWMSASEPSAGSSCNGVSVIDPEGIISEEKASAKRKTSLPDDPAEGSQRKRMKLDPDISVADPVLNLVEVLKQDEKKPNERKEVDSLQAEEEEFEVSVISNGSVFPEGLIVSPSDSDNSLGHSFEIISVSEITAVVDSSKEAL